jgi:hypothetical protein
MNREPETCMALIEIDQVKVTSDDPQRLWGAGLDAPVPGSRIDQYVLKIAGWVLGRSAQAAEVEVLYENRVIRRERVRMPRPDVEERFAGMPGAGICGFRALVNLFGMTPEFELQVRAVMRDGSRMPLRTITGRREPVRSSFQPTMRPLMLTSLGRTGTTWLMKLLSAHPAIVAVRGYPYENRTASYWLHMAKVLTEPANHLQSAHPDQFLGDSWWIGANPFFAGHLSDQPDIGEWFARRYIEELTAFCQHSTEEFYQQVASAQRQPQAIYYLEKYHAASQIPVLTWELFPQAREIILVRDFRDMISSMIAFNTKRGYASFGREGVNSDEEFVRQLRIGVDHLLNCWKSRSTIAHLVRYEDLILRAEPTVQSILEYLGLDASSATIGAMLAQDRTESELEQHRTSQDPAKSIGRWHNDLSQSLRALSQQAFGAAIEEFGYQQEAPHA